jgi:signal transduction histidine kinase
VDAVSGQGREAGLVRWFDECAEQGIFTTDTRLVVTSWNRWLERHSGRAAAQTLGQSIFALYPDIVERGLDDRYHEALAGHASLVSHLLHRYLIPMEAKVGEHAFAKMPQRAQIAPLMSDARVVGTITVIDDVSERVAAEQELRRQIEAQQLARHAAEKALRIKDDFLATLSHEIRTPLNSVLGWTRILTEREVEPELLSRAVESIARNANVQARMIDDLLDTARMMAGKLRLQVQPLNLLALTSAAMDALAPTIDAKRIELRKSLDPAVQPVMGDPDRLQQVIWNLLSNAVKFTDEAGSIEVRVEQVPGRARLSVCDSGQGIDPVFLPFVFDRFRQADASGTRREGGLGLGLALVRELVQLHGGTVRADSPGRGQGSRFIVELPTIVSSQSRPTHATSLPNGTPAPGSHEGRRYVGDPDARHGDPLGEPGP